MDIKRKRQGRSRLSPASILRLHINFSFVIHLSAPLFLSMYNLYLYSLYRLFFYLVNLFHIPPFYLLIFHLSSLFFSISVITSTFSSLSLIFFTLSLIYAVIIALYMLQNRPKYNDKYDQPDKKGQRHENSEFRMLSLVSQSIHSKAGSNHPT